MPSLASSRLSECLDGFGGSRSSKYTRTRSEHRKERVGLEAVSVRDAVTYHVV